MEAWDVLGQDTAVSTVLRRCSDLVARVHGEPTVPVFVHSRSVWAAVMLSGLGILSARDTGMCRLADAHQRVWTHQADAAAAADRVDDLASLSFSVLPPAATSRITLGASCCLV